MTTNGFSENDFKIIVKQFKQREEDIAYLKSITKLDQLCNMTCKRGIVVIQYQKD